MEKMLKNIKFLDFLIILSSLSLLVAGYYRIHVVLSITHDYYVAHFGTVGLLYFVMGIFLLTLFFVLLTIKISKK